MLLFSVKEVSEPGPQKAVSAIDVHINPRDPKIENFQDRPPGLKFSIKIENFKRATHQTPNFVEEF